MYIEYVLFKSPANNNNNIPPEWRTLSKEAYGECARLSTVISQRNDAENIQ